MAWALRAAMASWTLRLVYPLALVDGLGHCYGLLGLHVDVGEATTHSVFFLVEGDLFAVGGGDDPVASGVVTDRESICL